MHHHCSSSFIVDLRFQKASLPDDENHVVASLCLLKHPRRQSIILIYHNVRYVNQAFIFLVPSLSLLVFFINDTHVHIAHHHTHTRTHRKEATTRSSFQPKQQQQQQMG